MNHQATKAPRKLILDEPARQTVDMAIAVEEWVQNNSSMRKLGVLVVTE